MTVKIFRKSIRRFDRTYLENYSLKIFVGVATFDQNDIFGWAQKVSQKANSYLKFAGSKFDNILRNINLTACARK